jgi:hypothetical protein
MAAPILVAMSTCAEPFLPPQVSNHDGRSACEGHYSG